MFFTFVEALVFEFTKCFVFFGVVQLSKRYIAV